MEALRWHMHNVLKTMKLVSSTTKRADNNLQKEEYYTQLRDILELKN